MRPKYLYISMNDRRDALNLRLPFSLGYWLLRRSTIVSRDVCDAFGRPRDRVMRLSDIPAEELQAQLSSGVFISSGGAHVRLYSE